MKAPKKCMICGRIIALTDRDDYPVPGDTATLCTNRECITTFAEMVDLPCCLITWLVIGII